MLSYRIDGQFVEVSLGERYTPIELRDLFLELRDDATLPGGALLLFDASARREVLSEEDVRARLGMLVDILGPQMGPAFAAIVSSASALTGQVAQREASASGLRCALFIDAESARHWLAAVALAPNTQER